MMPACSLSELADGFIDREYRGQPNAASRLAIVTRSTKRTAQNWLARLNLPSADAIGALMEEHPEFEAAVFANNDARRQLRQQAQDAADAARARLAQRA